MEPPRACGFLRSPKKNRHGRCTIIGAEAGETSRGNHGDDVIWPAMPAGLRNSYVAFDCVLAVSSQV